jgi:hypothetical protein
VTRYQAAIGMFKQAYLLEKVMPAKASSELSLPRLILVPALIALVFTIVRVLGEVNHWSERWFEPVTRGVIPTAFGWVFGATWLAAPFGVYFALKLSAAEQGPESPGKAVFGAILSLSIAFLGMAHSRQNTCSRAICYSFRSSSGASR